VRPPPPGYFAGIPGKFDFTPLSLSLPAFYGFNSRTTATPKWTVNIPNCDASLLYDVRPAAAPPCHACLAHHCLSSHTPIPPPPTHTHTHTHTPQDYRAIDISDNGALVAVFAHPQLVVAAADRSSWTGRRARPGTTKAFPVGVGAGPVHISTNGSWCARRPAPFPSPPSAPQVGSWFAAQTPPPLLTSSLPHAPRPPFPSPLPQGGLGHLRGPLRVQRRHARPARHTGRQRLGSEVSDSGAYVAAGGEGLARVGVRVGRHQVRAQVSPVLPAGGGVWFCVDVATSADARRRARVLWVDRRDLADGEGRGRGT
jgi:hypothetical protein